MPCAGTLPFNDQTWTAPREAGHGDEACRVREHARPLDRCPRDSMEQFLPKVVLRLEALTGFRHVADGRDASFHHSHPRQATWMVSFRAEHGCSATNALRIVRQRRREQSNGKFFVGEVTFRSQWFFWFGAVRVMAATALDRENPKFVRPQTQPPRLVQQRRKMRGGAKFGRQGCRIHRAPKLPQNRCAVNVFRDGNSGFVFMRPLIREQHKVGGGVDCQGMMTTPFKRLILRTVLRDVYPMVIRLVAVPDCLELSEFDEIFHAVLGWKSAIGYSFKIHGQEFNSFQRKIRSKKLRDFRLHRQETFLYTLGAMDQWEWELRVIDLQEGTRGDEVPVCVEGRGATPPQYCGGATGYRLMLKRQEMDENMFQPAQVYWKLSVTSWRWKPLGSICVRAN